MTRKECFEIVVNNFVHYIAANQKNFKDYCYCNHKACDNIIEFRKAVENCGLKFGKVFHANGIGNNNECVIYVESQDKDGFIIKKEVCEFYYCYGIHGGCFTYVKDLATGEKSLLKKHFKEDKNMKTWKIPVSWTVTSTVEVEAKTLSEAIEKAKYDNLPLPEESYYLDESWAVDDECGEDYIRELWNNGMEDCQ